MKKLAILLSLCCTSIWAQDTTRQAIDLTVGLNLSGGNNPFYGGNIKSAYSLDRGPWEFTASPVFTLNYVSQNNVSQLARREGYFNTSLAHRIDATWKVMFFAEAEHSYIRKIQLRYTGGFGPAVKWSIKKTAFQLSTVVLAERLLSEPPTTRDYLVLRSSTRAKVTLKTRQAMLSSTTIAQPAIYANQGLRLAQHFILRSQNKLEFPFAKRTAIGFSYDMNYQTYPTTVNSTVKAMDWNATVYLTWKAGQ